MSNLKTELNQLGADIVKDAKANVPVRTGALKRSIDYSVDVKSVDDFSLTISELDYGKYVNANDHYLTDAISKNIQDGIFDITTTITETILQNIIK